jgi:hypothetical protein
MTVQVQNKTIVYFCFHKERTTTAADVPKKVMIRNKKQSKKKKKTIKKKKKTIKKKNKRSLNQ